MNNAMLNTALTAARSAAKIILTGLDRIDSVRIAEKNRNDFVTSVDKAAETEIIAILKEAYPDHLFLAEESFNDTKLNKNDNFWIIDPIDGTTNFIHRIPHFATSIAFYSKGRVELGLIYDPVKDELFSAVNGKGARCNQNRIRVNQCKKVEEALIAISGGGFDETRNNEFLTIVNNIFSNAAGVRRSGSAALDLAYVAAGRYDGFIDIGLQPWDVAAGNLMVTEAGGYVRDFKGAHDSLVSKDIITANPSLWPQLQKLVIAR